MSNKEERKKKGKKDAGIVHFRRDSICNMEVSPS